MARLSPSENDLLAYCKKLITPKCLIMPADYLVVHQIVYNVTLSMNDARESHYSLLLNMSLGDDSPASLAVLQGMLSLSALYLHGPTAGLLHKVKALSALSLSSTKPLLYKEGLQHIAANMLLCLFEVSNVSKSSEVATETKLVKIHGAKKSVSGWESHACCAKTLVKFLFDETQEQDGEAALMFDWVYYHDVLAKFSRVHVTTAAAPQNLCRKNNTLIRSKNIVSPLKKIVSPLFGVSNLIMVFCKHYVVFYLFPEKFG